MPNNIPTNEPQELVAGDTWEWTRSLADYPAPTWSLVYHFHKSGNTFNVTATTSGTDHAVTIAKGTTANYVAGTYMWDAYVDNGTKRYRVDSGTLIVLPDLTTGTATDRRSHAKITLDAIEAVIEGRAAKDQESYSINGRSLSRTSIPDLLVLRDRYKAEVALETRADRINNGLGHKGRVLVRFGRAR